MHCNLISVHTYLINFQVIDLLNPGAKRSNLAVRWNKRSRAFVVDNLFSIECGELDDLLAVLEVTHINQKYNFQCILTGGP